MNLATRANRARKNPNSGIGVHHDPIMGQVVNHRGYLIDQSVDSGWAVLEERPRRHTPAAAGGLLVNPGAFTATQLSNRHHQNIFRNRDSEVAAFDNNHAFACAIADPDRDLGGFPKTSINKQLFRCRINRIANIRNDHIV